MMFDSHLLFFGIVLWLAGTAFVLSLFGEQSMEAVAPKDMEELAKKYLLSQGELTEKSRQLASEAKARAALEQQCRRLREELQQQSSQLTADFRSATFEQLQSLLTNYPTACKMAEIKPDLPAKNLVALFVSLENLLASWGYEVIGEPGEKVSYNPQWHQPDRAEITPGELVYIRFVGYREGDRILIPAKVSRTLPGEK
ncbi:MAG: molecular chaperone GrpE [Gomphosphaeria aponina SAG 52.96 = DSM 107014]|uniref:Molecular chaperone GrpE n=1 Tax=Gomphosphaeria aponina SAG 52.96 = DSM 107014 TaxID=1521640 RepID=A0A941GRU1_9CHRO|nr:molecular chaperone GrpE [Gomphosphaeria aponina SAG 52.96 = DSM 107014]